MRSGLLTGISTAVVSASAALAGAILSRKFGHGVKTDGGAEAGPGAKVLAELAGLIADGHLEVPIANVYPLAQVREAYTELERRHTHGKIVLRP